MDPLFNYYDTVNFRSILGEKKCKALEIHDRVEGDRDIDYYAPRKVEVASVILPPAAAIKRDRCWQINGERPCLSCENHKDIVSECLAKDAGPCCHDRTWRSWKERITEQ